MRFLSESIRYLIIFLASTGMVSCKSENKVSTGQSKEESTTHKNQIVKILFAGDLLLDRGVRKVIDKKGLDHVFLGVDSLISEHDYFVVNLETPLTDIESPLNKKYIFRSDPKHAKRLKKHGVSHAVLSNNHSMDQGKEGLLDTYENLVENGIEVIGFGKKADEFCTPVLIETPHHKIALFGSVQIPIENWFQVDDRPGVCQQEGEVFEEMIAEYKSSNPEHIVIINLHWGMEYLSTPNFTQIEHAKNLIDAGADAIIGHHPHVIQSSQEYEGKMIYYSIGNFIFDSTHPLSKKAHLISVEITSDGKVSCNPFRIEINECRPELSSN